MLENISHVGDNLIVGEDLGYVLCDNIWNFVPP